MGASQAGSTAAPLAEHEVVSPCGQSDDNCHLFPTGCSERPLRHLLLRFSGVWDSHYIGVNRLRLYGAGGGELGYSVLAADGSAEGAAAADCVKGDGGWWAQAGDEHSLVLELEEAGCVASVGLWCANAGATPRQLRLYDGREVDAGLCERRDALQPPGSNISFAVAPPIVHSVCSGCGGDDHRCAPFPVQCPGPVRQLLVRFSGIHGSHYIGINRLRLFSAERELCYRVVLADGSTDGAAEAACVGVNGGWWAVCEAEHSLLLELTEPACVTSLGLWCANAGATPKEMRIVTDMSWMDQLVEVLEAAAAEPGGGLAAGARRLVGDHSALLVGLAQGGNARLRDALLRPVLAGLAPKFPVKEDDALGRLQALLFCDMCQSAAPGRGAGPAPQGLTGMAWQEFALVGAQLPRLEELEVSVTSQLAGGPAAAWKATDKDEWLGTRLYVPPGGTISLLSSDCGEGWHVRVGAHTDNISQREVWQRWPRVSLRSPLVPNQCTTVATPFGGLLYLVRSSGASSSATVRCWGDATLQPLVNVSSGVDTAALAASPGGWVDCEGDKVILTLPVRCVREAIAAGGDVVAALRFYDSLWDSYHQLSPRVDPRRQRIVPDVQTSHGWMHAGYPIMTNYGEVLEVSAANPIPRVLDAERLKREGNWGLFHEMGHNMQRDAWTFEGTVEVTVNLFTLWGFNQLCVDCIEKHIAPPEEFYAAGCPRDKWNDDPFLALRTYAQVLVTFGWAPLQATFQAYAAEGDVKRDYAQQVKDFVHRWSLAVGRDLRPHWRRWGFGDVLGPEDSVLGALQPWTFD